jgi:uncharacterized membrane protein
MAYFKAFTFDGKRSAQKAFDKIADNLPSYAWYEDGDVAEISVNKSGHYRVHSTWAQDSSNVSGGIGIGAVLGGLIGLIFGPGGALAGAVLGGSFGGLIGETDNIDINDPALDDFAASLVPDSSALIILGDADTVAAFTTELADYEVKTFETEVDKEIIDKIKKAMKKK